jgi:PAS domain S-box-containing protein
MTLPASHQDSRGEARPLRVLLVDDEPTQRKIGRLRLEEAGYVVETAADASEAFEKTSTLPPDAILSDVLMGDVDGFVFCRRLREDARFDSIPVILLSEHYDAERDPELCARVGAARIVERTPDFGAELSALRTTLASKPVAGAAVPDTELYEKLLSRNAKQITRLIGEAHVAEERYRMLFEHANDAITLLAPDGTVLEANARWRTLIGVEPAAMRGRNFREFAPAGQELWDIHDFYAAINAGVNRSGAVPLRNADGGVVYVEFSLAIIELADERAVLSIGRDVTAEVLARRALAAAEERYRTLVERLPDVLWTATADGHIVFATPNLIDLLGYTAVELAAETLEERLTRVHPDDRRAVSDGIAECVAHGQPFDVECRVRHKRGHWLWIRNRVTARYERSGIRYLDGLLSDINDHKILEESFHQAQKMEAIGRLTGGIAHDFNNILAAILANSDFLLESLDSKDPRRTDAGEIRVAAERAAALTRQLLAFSRRQVLEPAVVDLNSTVSGLEKMLCRLIGEDISLTVVPGSALGSVRVDVGQLEQVIMNLVVNARDAMPTGGQLSIETANVELTDAYADNHTPVIPGPYVMLAVSDTGSGMDEATQRRLFEPFFTTKEVGKGTGLGLSTCYGIIKQSGGYIWVYSEPGHGSVFKIYLPRVDALAADPAPNGERASLEGSETVLLVEDDPRVRSAVKRMLELYGYHTLVAADAREAMALAERHAGPIAVVLTDVVMPLSSGPQVAERLRRRFGCKVLFMSGYTDHAVLRSGVTQPGHSFIQKPFSPEGLARKLREVLDA